MAEAAIEAFVNGEVDSVYLVYNEFKSVMQQRVVVERLLPIPAARVQRRRAGRRRRRSSTLRAGTRRSSSST